jgi:DNA-binding NarL/FixJ family response regulator
MTYLVKLWLRAPDWYIDGRIDNNFIIFTLGLIFAITMARTVIKEKESRVRAEQLLTELEASHQQLKTYSEQVAELATTRERNRLARDIHDTLGHYLTVINVQLEKALAFRKRDPHEADLAKAVHAVHKGIYQLDPSVAGKVFASLSQPHNADNAYSHSPAPTSPMAREASSANSHPLKASDLTGREIEVLRLIAKGATNREIAEKLVISEGTVKNHISSILSHLGLRDRTQAAIYAKECGLL